MLTSNKFKVFLVLHNLKFESPDFSHFKTIILRDSRSRLVVQDRDETLKIVSRHETSNENSVTIYHKNSPNVETNRVTSSRSSSLFFLSTK